MQKPIAYAGIPIWSLGGFSVRFFHTKVWMVQSSPKFIDHFMQIRYELVSVCIRSMESAEDLSQLRLTVFGEEKWVDLYFPNIQSPPFCIFHRTVPYLLQSKAPSFIPPISNSLGSFPSFKLKAHPDLEILCSWPIPNRPAEGGVDRPQETSYTTQQQLTNTPQSSLLHLRTQGVFFIFIKYPWGMVYF